MADATAAFSASSPRLAGGDLAVEQQAAGTGQGHLAVARVLAPDERLGQLTLGVCER